MPKWMRPFLPKKFVAITLSGTLCYYRTEDHLADESLRVHESVHARQYRENGWFKFVFLYCWYTLRYGYWKNPMEAEARQIAGR